MQKPEIGLGVCPVLLKKLAFGPGQEQRVTLWTIYEKKVIRPHNNVLFILLGDCYYL